MQKSLNFGCFIVIYRGNERRAGGLPATYPRMVQIAKQPALKSTAQYKYDWQI